MEFKTEPNQLKDNVSTNNILKNNIVKVHALKTVAYRLNVIYRLSFSPEHQDQLIKTDAALRR
jgi:hypothetical protein